MKPKIVCDYKTISDDQLIAQISSGDSEAYKVLYDRYLAYSRKIICEYLTKFYYDGISFDELQAVALSSINKALSKYLPNKGHFYSLWKTICVHGFNDYARANSYNFGAKMFSGVSLDEEVYDDSGTILSDVIGEEDNYEIDNSIVENFRDFLLSNKSKLDKKDIKIFDYLVLGYKAEEIAQKLKIKSNKVYYRVSILKNIYEVYKATIKK